MIDLIIDLPEECKTAEEIINETGRIRYDLLTAEVFEHGRFTIKMSQDQFHACRNVLLGIFYSVEDPEQSCPMILGFKVEIKV